MRLAGFSCKYRSTGGKRLEKIQFKETEIFVRKNAVMKKIAQKWND